MDIMEEAQTDMSLFINCVFVLDFDPMVSFKEKKKWRDKVTAHGGTLSYIVTRQVTYVVLVKDLVQTSSLKQQQASRYDIPVVSKTYLEDCLSCLQLLPAQKYLIQGEDNIKDFTKGKITTKVKKSGPQKPHKPVTLSSVKSWHLDDPESPISNTDQYDLAKWSILRNGNKLQVLEIHRVHSGQYRLYSQPGEITQGKHLSPLEDPVVWYFEDVLDVISGYDQLHKLYQAAPSHMAPWKNPKFSSNQIGSNKLKLLVSEQCIFGSDVSLEVGQFVELIWREAVQEIEEILTIPIQHIKKEKVEEAECLLQQIKQEVTSHMVTRGNKVKELLEKLYTDFLPHRDKHKKFDITARDVTSKLDLCQLIKDLHEVSEATDWSTAASTAAKFWALRCHVTCLDQSAEEFNQIKNIILDSSQGVEVQAIYEVGRTIEDIRFCRQIGNKKLLMHSSSPSNFLGILSRGLLLPNTVVTEHGVSRTDGGKLGCGIYFSDSSSTCIQYSTLTHHGSSRLLLVCEVALGQIFKTEKIDSKLTTPPGGYQSILGVKQGDTTLNSDFMDDEYVIYSPSQQRIRYVVQYRLQNDPPPEGALSELVVGSTGEEEEVIEAFDKIEISDVKNLPDPLKKVQAGLVGKKNQSVPLKGVHVRAKLLDMVAQVKVMQSYHNNSDVAIEAKYVFPLETTAAVCGFEAYINGKHIIGKVKEKEKAHKEYKEAVSKGHGAYLMDEEEPDVFTVSVGNLPPKADVLIKITYISELQVDGDNIVFCLPSKVASWVKDTALAQQTQDELASVKVKDTQHLDTSVQVAVEMPFEIRKISSPTHQLKLKKTATKAVLEIPRNSCLDDGFKLLVTLAEIHVPRMWIEKHDEKESTACMLAFYPEFDCSVMDNTETILLLDMSNSMKDQATIDAKKVALLTLEKLPPESEFNILVFGTTVTELFQSSQKPTKDNINKAIQFVQDAKPVLGCSNVLLPLTSVFLLSPPGGIRNVLLVSDGHLNHGEQLLQTVADNSSRVRIFTLTVGPSPNHHLMQSLASRGGGTYSYFDGKSKSSWERKVQSVIDKTSQWGIQGVEVEWQQHSDNLPDPVQAPAHLTSIFNGSQIVVYGYVENCTQAKLKAMVDGYNFETVVSSSELSMTQGKMLHQLTARAVIRDYEDGILNEDVILQRLEKQNKKDYVIELSKEFSIVTPYTSFVAIEERDQEEEKLDSESVEKLIGEEDVDILPYVGWTVPDNWEEKNTAEVVKSLLRQGEIAEGFSQSEAERCYLMALQYEDDIREDEDLQDLVRSTAKKFFEYSVSEKGKETVKMIQSIAPDKKTVFVQTLAGRILTCKIKSMDDMEALKREIKNQEGIPYDQQRLICKGGKYLDDLTLADLEDGDTVYLVLKLRGGVDPPVPQTLYNSVDVSDMNVEAMSEGATENFADSDMSIDYDHDLLNYAEEELQAQEKIEKFDLLKSAAENDFELFMNLKTGMEVNGRGEYQSLDINERQEDALIPEKGVIEKSVIDKYFPPDFNSAYFDPKTRSMRGTEVVRHMKCSYSPPRQSIDMAKSEILSNFNWDAPGTSSDLHGNDLDFDLITPSFTPTFPSSANVPIKSRFEATSTFRCESLPSVEYRSFFESLASTTYSPTSPAYSPTSPVYSLTAPAYSPTAPAYGLTSSTAHTSTAPDHFSALTVPSRPDPYFDLSLQQMYRLTAPSYSSSKPTFVQSAHSYSPVAPSYRPTAPANVHLTSVHYPNASGGMSTATEVDKAARLGMEDTVIPSNDKKESASNLSAAPGASRDVGKGIRGKGAGKGLRQTMSLSKRHKVIPFGSLDEEGKSSSSDEFSDDNESESDDSSAQVVKEEKKGGKTLATKAARKSAPATGGVLYSTESSDSSPSSVEENADQSVEVDNVGEREVGMGRRTYIATKAARKSAPATGVVLHSLECYEYDSSPSSVEENADQSLQTDNVGERGDAGKGGRTYIATKAARKSAPATDGVLDQPPLSSSDIISAPEWDAVKERGVGDVSTGRGGRGR